MIFQTRMLKPRLAALCLAAGLMMAGGGYAFAQQQADDDALGGENSPLNLPNDVAVFGKFDPAIRKATAIVNGFIITDTDVDQRLNLVLAANGQQVSAEERDRLRLQVLRNLIDETLQIQEAKAQEIEVTQADVDQTYARVAAQNFGQNVDAMDAYLAKIGSSAAWYKTCSLTNPAKKRRLRTSAMILPTDIDCR